MKKIFYFAVILILFALFGVNPATAGDLTVTGSVGIGTTNPQTKLDIAGHTAINDNKIWFRIANDNNHYLVFENLGAGHNNNGLRIHEYGGFRFSTSLGDKVEILQNGNVGIGTNNPTEKLYVVGNIYATGAITSGSSRELKEDISELSLREAMETVEALEPVKFKYKTDTRDQHIGFVAEDVPEAVATPDRKSLSTMDIVAVLTKVVQEQQRVIADMSKQLNAFEKRFSSIEVVE